MELFLVPSLRKHVQLPIMQVGKLGLRDVENFLRAIDRTFNPGLLNENLSLNSDEM